MPEFRHPKPPAPPVVHQENVKLAPFSRSSEVRGILRQWLAQCTSGQQAQKYTHVFHSWNYLFDADARNVQGGTAAPISAFPSLVHTRNVPVSAIAKFAPVIPAPAARNRGRALFRMASVRKCGSSLL